MTKDEIINTAEERFKKLYIDIIDKIDQALISTYMNGTTQYYFVLENPRLRHALVEHYKKMFNVENKNDTLIFNL